jgi:glucokinase
MADERIYAVGVDLGGTAIKAGLISKDGKIIKKTSVDTLADKGPDIVIDQIKKGIQFVIEDVSNNQIMGIGVGFPGVVSVEKGTVENPPNLPGWEKVALGEILQNKFNINVTVENDAKAAAVGELIFGAGRGLTNFVMVTLGTGVGGGIIINKKLYRGEIGAAGEIGHTTINYNGQKCNCGSFGCLETYVGNNYLVNHVKDELKNHKDSLIFELIKGDLDSLTPKTISTASEKGDDYAASVIIDTGRYLGYGLASVLNILDISKIIIGGGVSGFGKILFQSTQDTIKERALKSLAAKVQVLPAELKNDAGILGASALVFHRA